MPSSDSSPLLPGISITVQTPDLRLIVQVAGTPVSDARIQQTAVKKGPKKKRTTISRTSYRKTEEN